MDQPCHGRSPGLGATLVREDRRAYEYQLDWYDPEQRVLIWLPSEIDWDGIGGVFFSCSQGSVVLKWANARGGQVWRALGVVVRRMPGGWIRSGLDRQEGVCTMRNRAKSNAHEVPAPTAMLEGVLLRWFVGFACMALATLPLTAVRAQVDPTRFESDIVAFEQADLASPPPTDPVLFVGSSSVRMWSNLAAAFPDYPVINRGFGGSYMSDVLYYFDRVVAVYKPALVVVYEGDNDLAGGMSVDDVYADYMEFLALVAEKLPGAEVAFIATKPSPSRAAYLEVTRELNTRLQALADKAYHLWYIDVFTPMLGADGQPRPELFGSRTCCT